jgi:hypothetical protein
VDAEVDAETDEGGMGEPGGLEAMDVRDALAD